MPRLLIFSDIHNDRQALQRLIDVEADYYFAAGDLVSWARGLDKMAEVMKLHSRPADAKEPWFPSQLDDWVRLFGHWRSRNAKCRPAGRQVA